VKNEEYGVKIMKLEVEMEYVRERKRRAC